MTNEAEGKVILSGFKLDPAEKSIVDNLIKNYKHKIGERIRYEEIRIRIKKSPHKNIFLHEVQGIMIANKTFNAKSEDFNLFAAISDVMEKLMHEAEHNKRTKKQI